MVTKAPPRGPLLTGTATRTAPSYETRILHLHSHVETAEKQLNTLSGDGWDIKAVVIENTRHVVYMQRVKRRDPDA